MSFREIGQKLRAYRMESGLKAEDISARLGISRAALYRYEKGEVIKLETISRLAELLKISPLTLLGVGVEYYSKPSSFNERLRHIEEEADQILEFSGPLCDLLTSDHYDAALAQIIEEHLATLDSDAQTVRGRIEDAMAPFKARKKAYQRRKPTMIAILTASSIQKLLTEGIAPSAQISGSARYLARQAAYEELERVASLMESEPLGLQLGVLARGEPNGPFALFRAREHVSLAINPFPADTLPSTSYSVAMITNAEDAITTHQRAFEQAWSDVLKGTAGAKLVRDLMLTARQQ